MDSWLLGKSYHNHILCEIRALGNAVRQSEANETLDSGDLEDEKVKKEYERAYGILINFFHQYFHA